MTTALVRKIIHVDMDAFYASVEQRDRPELKGRPVVVGGSPEGRGVVASCSYEARKFGIRSAMSSAEALRRCRDVVFIHPQFSKYHEVSDAIRAIFLSVTPLVEPLSLDEAYLDVTTNLLNEPSASRIAMHIRERIKNELHLTASAGVASNKFIAKIASDLNKPDGLTVIRPEEVFNFLTDLPVARLWGVGPVTEKKLHALGWMTAGQIRDRPRSELIQQLGSFGGFLHDLSHGNDDRPVQTVWERKSLGTEETFPRDILDRGTLHSVLFGQADEIAESLDKMECYARCLSIKVRYGDFKTITRSRTMFQPSRRARTLFDTAFDLLENHTEAGRRPIRLLGISVSGFVDGETPIQLWLDLEGEDPRANRVAHRS